MVNTVNETSSLCLVNNTLKNTLSSIYLKILLHFLFGGISSIFAYAKYAHLTKQIKIMKMAKQNRTNKNS